MSLTTLFAASVTVKAPDTFTDKEAEAIMDDVELLMVNAFETLKDMIGQSHPSLVLDYDV